MELSPAMPRKDKPRYFTSRPGAAGELPRYFWQPSASLREQGWELKRLPDNWEDYSDPDELAAAAAGAAIQINLGLDKARKSAEAKITAPPEPIKRTIGNLIAAYKLGDSYLTLSAKTRTEYDKCLTRIMDWAVDGNGKPGGALIAALDQQRLKNFRKSMAATPAMCNAVVRVLRLVLNWGCDDKNRHPNGGRWCTSNVAAKPDIEGMPVSGRIWPAKAVALMVAKADAMGLTGLGTAIVLNEWIGQREGDILRLPRTVLRNGSLIFRQAKGTNEARGKLGAGVVLPVHQVPQLTARIERQLAWNDTYHQERAARAAKLAGRVRPLKPKAVPLAIVQGEEGQPYKADQFRHKFSELRAAVEADMLEAAGWEQREATRIDKTGKTVPCLVWRNPALEKALGNLGPKEREAELERRRRLDAGFEIDYLLPGRDIEDEDAFRVYIGELQFMHLRHTAITRLAECDVTPQDIASVSGHSLKTVTSILERYLIRTAKMAGNAFSKRLAKEAAGG